MLAIPQLAKLTDSVKAVFTMGTGESRIGLHRRAAILNDYCVRFVPLVLCHRPFVRGFDLPTLKILNNHPKFTDTSAESIFYYIPRTIGIGGIFTAGLLSILKMSKVIVKGLPRQLEVSSEDRGRAGPLTGQTRTSVIP